MNKIDVLFSRFRHFPARRFVTVMLVVPFALAWSTGGFCGEIHDAAQKGDLQKVAALLKDNPALVYSKSEVDGAAPLHNAAFYGQKDVAELLLANHADVNAKDGVGQTPLFDAASQGHKEVVELLLANHAEINAKDGIGQTPLHLAAFYGHKDVAELLLANHAEINAKNKLGGTPLHWAENNDQNDMVEFLRQRGGHE